jgi:lambda family phage portal protein
MSFIDRAVAFFSPERALRRAAASSLLASGQFGLGPARSRALSSWNPGVSAPNSWHQYDLPILRARSENLFQENAIAHGAVCTSVSGAIGTGLSMQPRIDREFLKISDDEADAWEEHVRREWEFWAETVPSVCDAERKLNFYGLQAVIERSALVRGDVFALTPSIPRVGSPYRLAVQIVEADRVSNPNGAPDSDRLSGGIEFDGYGAPIRYHFRDTHPGDHSSSKAPTWTPIEAFGAQSGRPNVLHIHGDINALRPGQARSLPWLATVIEPLKQLSRFTEAELQAAVNNAILGLFIRMDMTAFDQLFDGNRDVFEEDAKANYLNQRGQWDRSMPGGQVVNLLPGEEPVPFSPAHPNAGLDPFVAAVMKQIGAALQIPFEVLIQNFNASYSASRAALLKAHKTFALRRANAATCFCQPIYDLWLSEAILLGRVRAPGFFADPLYRKAWSGAEWIGDGPGSIDPQREIAAAKARVDLEVSTLESESVAYDGIPWSVKHKQRAKERKLQAKDATAAPAKPAKPAPGAPA